MIMQLLFRKICSIIFLTIAFSAHADTLTEGIHKINDDLYVGKKYDDKQKDDLYFALERVTDKNIVFWKEFVETQGSKTKRSGVIDKKSQKQIYLTDMIVPFETALKFYNSSDVWIAYVTNKKITKEAQDLLQREGDIEMTCTVMTTKEIPFYSPMGIFRTAEFWGLKRHEGLAMNLHSFIAKAILVAYGNKEYMITKPVDSMRDIIIKNIPANAVWIGDAEQLEDIRFYKKHKLSKTDFDRIQTLENIIKNIDNYYTQFYQDNFSALSDFRLKKFIQQKISGIKQNNKNTDEDKKELVDSLHKKIADIKKENENDTYYSKQITLFFPKNIDDDHEARFALTQKNNKKEITIIKRDDTKVTFAEPSFYEHKNLAYQGSIPMIIINIDALAGFMKLDPWEKK